MKKLMLVMACSLTAAGLFAAPRSLVATAEVAPFAEIAPTVTALGTMVGNPMLPAIALSGAEQMLLQSYGKMRKDAPIRLQIYLEGDTIDLAKADKLLESGKAVLVYPIADAEEAFLKKHEGATKTDAGTIHLLPGGGRAEETYAKFAADGKYCVFAQTAELAAQAAADVDKRAARVAARPNNAPARKTSLVRVSLTEKGMGLLVSAVEQAQALQKDAFKDLGDESGAEFLKKLLAIQSMSQEQSLAMLKGAAGATLAFDVDDYGLAISGGLRRKRDAAPLALGEPLPAGALDMMPAGANLTLAYNRQAQFAGSVGDADGLARQKAQVSSLLKDLGKTLAAEAAKNEGLKKYEALLADLLGAYDEALAGLAYPQAGDWDAAAVGFDAAQHPVVVGGGAVSTAAAEFALSVKFLDRVQAALERQWPGKNFLKKGAAAGAYAFDWNALVDLVLAETGLAANADTVKTVAEAKKVAANVLGGLSTELVISADGQRARLASPGVKLAAAPAGAGEARFLAAMPEAAKNRPSSAFYLTPYALARDVVAPIVLKLGDKDLAAQAQALTAALPPASPKGALAGATWAGRNGSLRFVLRLTADEVKSIAAAAAALGGESGDSDDDDDDDE